MRTPLLATLLILTALNTAAKPGAFSTFVGDPLTDHIKKELTRGQGQITGSSLDASGRTIPLKIVDPLAASLREAPLRDAVADTKTPLNGLKPASGLEVKASKKRVTEKPLRAPKAQLIKISDQKQWERK
jgi:hypothetical protein